VNVIRRKRAAEPPDLSSFTDESLMDELLRRRENRERDWSEVKWCDDCTNFQAWTREIDPPDDYNPCQLRHKMRFHVPDYDPHAPFGYYLPGCRDREETNDEPT
jgi:hypothetical protein